MRVFIFFLPSCSNDYVRIVDFKDNELGRGKYCGTKSSFAVESQRSAEVILHSDRAFEKKGFNATYFVMDKYSRSECQRLLSTKINRVYCTAQFRHSLRHINLDKRLGDVRLICGNNVQKSCFTNLSWQGGVLKK